MISQIMFRCAKLEYSTKIFLKQNVNNFQINNYFSLCSELVLLECIDISTSALDQISIFVKFDI